MAHADSIKAPCYSLRQGTPSRADSAVLRALEGSTSLVN
jgi:hypothetical protein